jgi:hypothetical protein
MQPVSVNQRMLLRRDDFHVLEADALQVVRDDLSGLANIVFVLFGGADAGNAKQVFQLVKEALLILASIGNSGGNGCSCHRKTPFLLGRIKMGKQESITQGSDSGFESVVEDR